MKSLTHYFILKVTTSFLLLPFTPMAWAQTTPDVANWKTTKHGKHLTVRINPGADLSLYNTISVGDVAYTGPAKKLKQKDSDKLESLLHHSLAKDLPTAKLSQDTSARNAISIPLHSSQPSGTAGKLCLSKRSKQSSRKGTPLMRCFIFRKAR